MRKYKNQTLKGYLDVLSKRTPVPGGGSTAALTGALGVSLISMVARYSLGKGKPAKIEANFKRIVKESNSFKKRFLELVDLDAEAYLNVVKAKNASKKIRQKALAKARAVPLEVTKLCYRAVVLTPDLVKDGNKYLMSDVEVALELILAAFNSALALLKHS